MFQVSGPMLGTALLDFTNMVLSGGVPKEVRHVFFGANLHALPKKDGGLRLMQWALHFAAWYQKWPTSGVRQKEKGGSTPPPFPFCSHYFSVSFGSHP